MKAPTAAKFRFRLQTHTLAFPDDEFILCISFALAKRKKVQYEKGKQNQNWG